MNCNSTPIMATDGNSSSDDFQINELSKKLVRKTYLITYSRANESICPDRETFSQLVLKSFQQGKSSAKIIQWAVCMEPHNTKGIHYHMCIKFDRNQRWCQSREYLKSKNVNVHFSENHANYIAAYRYVCKSDKNVLLSPGHPDLNLTVSPKTSRASKAVQKRRRSSTAEKTTSGSPKKIKRLSKSEVMDVIKDKLIRDETQLLALANTQAKDGLMSLKNFIANTPQRAYCELISKTWAMSEAEQVIQRKSKNRIEHLQSSIEKPCVEECKDKTWLKMALEILKNNDVNKYVFADHVRELLKKGRGKGLNLMITGPSGCGKTFIINPLKDIFDTFSNPSSCKYAFVGVENKELIFLNDLRWTPEMIPWQEFLNLLEGQSLHLAAPKTHFSQDILLTSDIPIFATSIGMVEFVGSSTDIRGENSMMANRWREIKFYYSIPEEKQIKLKNCPRCFAELVFLGCDDI